MQPETVCSDNPTKVKVELDLHADTCAARENMVLLASLDITANVSYFPPMLDTLDDTPIGTHVGIYDDSNTDSRIDLLFHETLYLGDMLLHSLINPNQM